MSSVGDRNLTQNITCQKPTHARRDKCMSSKHNSHHPTFQQNSYRKLRDNTWGAIVSGVEPRPGDPIVVVTRRGSERSEVVAQVHWGNGSEWLCSLVQSSATGELGDATDEPVSTASKYPHLMRADRP